MQINPMQTHSIQASLELTLNQQETLRAAVDRIIPADDYPSGWEAGVGDFLALLLTREPHFLPRYEQGLDALDAAAQRVENAPFAELSPERQDTLLSQIEASESEESHFFRLLVQQAMEGYYADPGNGGNKDGVAWKMIGFQVTA